MSQGLVIGGTGMLAGVVRGLAARRWDLVVPSRTQRALGARDRRVHGVRAEWARPEALAEAVAGAAAAPFGVLVAWVHTPYRERVMEAVHPLLSPEAPVVEVWASASEDPLATLPAPALDRPTHQVVLGYENAGNAPRWLTNAEISEGVLSVVLAALSGAPPRVSEVGRLRPWPPRG